MKKIIIGEKYGRCTILKEVARKIYPSIKQKLRQVEYQCDCGRKKICLRQNLKRGLTQSCGCLQKEKTVRHGFAYHKLYKTWCGIKKRCNGLHKDYGGRGITYTDRWEEFIYFLEDMGETYKEGLWIDRIDNNGDYCKENCRRATIETQMGNRRNNVVYKGKCISVWARELGINRNVINKRLKRGRSFEKALNLVSV